jgi:hypothetical protein
LTLIASWGVLLAVATAQMGDFLTYLRMVALHGPAAEANPLVGHAALVLGVPGLMIAKLALIVVVATTFSILVRSHSRLAVTIATSGTVAGLLGAATNVLVAG